METIRFEDIVPDVREQKPKGTPAEWADRHLDALKRENERRVAGGERPIRKSRDFRLGVDLGQANDYTALVLLEWVSVTHIIGVNRPELGERGHNDPETWTLAKETADEWHVRFVERLRANYVDVTTRIQKALSSEALKGSETSVIVDATGVGRPVIDMMRADGLDPVPVIITSGNSETREGRFWHVPKRDLVGTITALLGKGQLQIAGEVPFREILVSELANFRVKLNEDTGHETYGAWREREHDDLVLATALACWGGLKQKKKSERFRGLRVISGRIAPRRQEY